MPADVIFINGRITTLDAGGTEADAVAVESGRFVAVGRRADVEPLAGPDTKVLDLNDRRVIPGLIDAHTHPLETLWLKNDWVDARFPGTDSVTATLAKLRDRVSRTPKGQWIFVACVSATENKFVDKRLPTRAELDAAAPDNPVILANGAHMAVVNDAALAALDIAPGQTALPKGGHALVDADGRHTGVITDGFADIPSAPAPSEVAGFYTEGIPAFWNSHGFTSMMAITPHHAVDAFKAVSVAVPAPNIRYSVSVWVSPDGRGFPQDLSGFEMPAAADPDYYRFVAIKAWIDGENDCRTGYMHEPYVGHFDIDPPGGRGALVTPQDRADAFVTRARQSGKAAMLHCSGDAAVDIGLTAYEGEPGSPGAIRRIEHFGMFQLTDRQLERAKALLARGLRISVQPIWLTELVRANLENMGAQRTRTGMRFRTLIEAGLEPAASTDMTGIYLSNINPFPAMAAVVTRESDAGEFEPDEAVSVQDAVRMWTVWPARAIGEFADRGTIEVGKLADMTVLSDDIFQIAPRQLATVTAAQTVVGGRVVYSR